MKELPDSFSARYCHLVLEPGWGWFWYQAARSPIPVRNPGPYAYNQVIIHTSELALQSVRFHTPAGIVYSKVKDERITVLFVCLGNASRSQMAEAFAKAYGPDVMRASSAGLLPARHVLSTTRMVMDEKSISLRGAVPKSLSHFALDEFDLIVNMSGHALPKTSTPVVKVLVRDPNGKDETVHRHVRDRVESVVEELVHMLRLARLEQYGQAKDKATQSLPPWSHAS